MLILCANNRLSRLLRQADAFLQQQAGCAIFPTLPALPLDAWLVRMGENIILEGSVPAPAVPKRVLSPFQTRLVWQQVIDAAEQADPTPVELALFDRTALAQTAAEAHALCIDWHLPEKEIGDGSEEAQRFLAWRADFLARCDAQGWLDAAGYHQRVTGWLAAGLGKLPRHVRMTGFDRLSPAQAALVNVLRKRGVIVEIPETPRADAPTPGESPAMAVPSSRQVHVLACADAAAECRLAADWARRMLEREPEARLGIVVADLEARRARLLPMLDEALETEGLARADDTPPRRYNVSLGLPLVRYGLVRTALTLLDMFSRHFGLSMADWGRLLCLPYWSADVHEADLRARLDARLREAGTSESTLAHCLSRLERLAMPSGDATSRLGQHLQALIALVEGLAAPRLPSAWTEDFIVILAAAGWPGERTLSSTEFQARDAFQSVLTAFSALDAFLGPLKMRSALVEFRRLCRETVFQPKTPGSPPVQVLGLIEAKGSQFDALWIMGMNDGHWPPPARPNPLLPAGLQRRHALPGASPQVQLAFARDIHAHLLRAAPRITFSHALKEGERALRPSPLLNGLPALPPPPLPERGRLSHIAPGGCGLHQERLRDDRAPVLADDVHIGGGSGLLKAQAICPAWAFYRYRLGARALATPAEAFDAGERGTLIHVMLENFWKNVRHSAAFSELMACGKLPERIAAAAEAALDHHERKTGRPLSPTRRRLEVARLIRLGSLWLSVDGDSGRASFEVIACEQAAEVRLGTLSIRLVVDRIDRLVESGLHVVIDYKTGSRLDIRHWLNDQARLVEPQLPLYAACVDFPDRANASGTLPDRPETAHRPGDAVAAVAFGRVRPRAAERRFQGVAVTEGILPKVKGMADSSAWPALLTRWQSRLLALAEEIRSGEAGVWFEDETALAYCEVLPLLRLAERRTQYEKSTEAGM